jgi:hypothetical protein
VALHGWADRYNDVPRSYTWLKNPSTGITFVNSFEWSTDEPIFVFTDMLTSNGAPNQKFVWEAISHEVKQHGWLATLCIAASWTGFPQLASSCGIMRVSCGRFMRWLQCKGC